MRVIAGRCAGARLSAPRGDATRPLTDRVKEALFAILQPRLPGARVLDLYAGSGAAGIEALSRGAAHSVFVERQASVAATIRDNLARTGLGEGASVVVADVERFLARDPDGRYAIAFLDPPYDVDVDPLVLTALVPWLDADGLVVVKHFWRTAPPSVPKLETVRARRFGETALTFMQARHEEVP